MGEMLDFRAAAFKLFKSRRRVVLVGLYYLGYMFA